MIAGSNGEKPVCEEKVVAELGAVEVELAFRNAGTLTYGAIRHGSNGVGEFWFDISIPC